MEPDKLKEVLHAIDDINRGDPKKAELDYSEKLTTWIHKLNPSPSEALQIAARGQHVGRWTLPRDSYPMDRGGYLRWREDLKKYHAKTVTDLMKEKGYDAATLVQVEQIILKKDLKENPEVQTMEDALCLVFLETQFRDLRAKTSDEKMKTILQKTWKKMSPDAQDRAQHIPMNEEDKQFLKDTLS